MENLNHIAQLVDLKLQISNTFMEIIYLRRQVTLCIEQLVLVRASNNWRGQHDLTQQLHDQIAGFQIEIRILRDYAKNLLETVEDYS